MLDASPSFKSYTRAGLGASYTLPVAESRSLIFFGKVDNLLDEKYFEEGFRAPGHVGRAGLTVRF